MQVALTRQSSAQTARLAAVLSANGVLLHFPYTSFNSLFGRTTSRNFGFCTPTILNVNLTSGIIPPFEFLIGLYPFNKSVREFLAPGITDNFVLDEILIGLYPQLDSVCQLEAVPDTDGE